MTLVRVGLTAVHSPSRLAARPRGRGRRCAHTHTHLCICIFFLHRLIKKGQGTGPYFCTMMFPGELRRF